MSFLVLAAAGLAFFAISSGKNGSAVTSMTRPGASPSVVAEVQTSLPTPNAVRSVAAPEAGVAAVRRPETGVRVVSVLLRSKPSAARVTVKGEFRGTTPLRLEGKPRDQLSVIIQKGDLVWRGTLMVNDRREQTVNIILPRPTLLPTPRPRSTSTLLTEGGRYGATLNSGIELYKQGWFGPAVGRFKQAAAINPRSAEAHLWWGRALTKANRRAEARRAFEKVIVLAKTGPLADEATSLLKKLP